MVNEPPASDQPPPPGDQPTPETPGGPPADRRAHESGPRRLTRSRTDEWIGGVAGGLAEYFDTDPTLIRVGFVVLAVITSGLAILGYIAAWIIIPEESAETAAGRAPARTSRRGTGALVWGAILVIGGAALLLAQVDTDIPLPSFRALLAAALVLVGLLMVVEARRGFHAGLTTLAIILTVILGAGELTSMNLAVDGAFGQQRHQILNADDLQGEYGHAFGEITMDLRDMEVPPGTTRIDVSVAFGQADVLLPDDVPYRLEGSALFGNVQAPDFDTAGIASSRTYTSPGYDEAEARLDIEISAAFGSGRVR